MKNKLTVAQQRIVDLLLTDSDLVMRTSRYGAHGASIVDPKKKNGRYHFMSFYQSTCNVLLSTGAFTEVGEREYRLTGIL